MLATLPAAFQIERREFEQVNQSGPDQLLRRDTSDGKDDEYITSFTVNSFFLAKAVVV